MFPMSLLAETTRAFLKPVEPFLDDEDVSEILINGHKQIYIEKKGKLILTDAKFADEEQLMAAVRNVAQFVGRKIDPLHPTLDARLPDGSRIHVVIPPCARRGIYMAIRKFSRENLTIKDLIKFRSLSTDMALFLDLAVKMSKNILVSGGTSSGKTTLLNVISGLIPDDQRIIVIEDSSELQLQQQHLVTMETRQAEPSGEGEVTIRDLLRSSLRMRPDRVIIGEVRGGEALDLLQAMNTGHSGSMATIHANNPYACLQRLETLALMSEVDLPWRALRSQVATAIEIVVQAARLRDGSRKITHISEVRGLDEAGNYQVADIFTFHIQKVDPDGKIHGIHLPTGEIPSFIKDAKAQGYKVNENMFKRR